MGDYIKYLRIPYQKNGRDYSGVDCYGLVMLVAKEQANIDLPDINNAPVEEYLINDIVNDYKNKFVKIDKPEPFCLVALSIVPPYTHHIGLVLEDCKRFIHIRESHTARIDSLDSKLWKPMIRGFYKYAE